MTTAQTPAQPESRSQGAPRPARTQTVKRAADLGIKGRSTMSKGELAEAIARRQD